MYKNPLWLLFLTVITLVTAWYGGVAFLRLHRYIQLDTQVETTDIQWSVKKLGEDRYRVNGAYSFIVEGQHYENLWMMQEVYRNPWAAEKALARHQSHRWTVWVDSSNPRYSSLQKTFPLKDCVSATVLLGLLTYFIGLGYYYKAKLQ